MRIEKRDEGGIIILTLSGEFGEPEVTPLRREIQSLIGDERVYVALNVHGLSYMNTSALACLIEESRRLRNVGGELVLAAPSKFVHKVVTTLGLDKVLKVFAGEEEALAFVRERGDATAPGFNGIPLMPPPDAPSDESTATT